MIDPLDYCSCFEIDNFPERESRFGSSIEALISAGLVLAVVQFSSVSAKMLSGHVQTNYTTAGAGESPVQANNSQSFAMQAKESDGQTAAKFQGTWTCLTIVVALDVLAVAPDCKSKGRAI